LIGEFEKVARLAWQELSSGRHVGKKISAVFVGGVLALTVGFAVYHYVTSLHRILASSKNPNRAAADAEAIEWINDNTNISDVLVSYRDPIFYLHTDRKATRSSSAVLADAAQEDQGALDQRANIIFTIIAESSAKYLVFTTSDFDLERQADLRRKSFEMLLEQNPEFFVPVFKSGTGDSSIYRIKNEAR